MIDLHVLTTNRLPSEWVDQCMESIEAAMDRSPVPVELHLTPESVGDFWGARWSGYELGRNEWVTYVDLDDSVDPDLFVVASRHLTPEVDSLQTKGFDFHVEFNKTYPTDRGVRIHRRSLVEESQKECTHLCCPSCHLYAMAENKKTIEDRLITMRVGYSSLAQQWRREHGMG